MADPIYVTRPYLPPLAELLPMLERIWETRVLTNGGPYHAVLEQRLGELLEAEHVSLVSNGTAALSLAIEAAKLEGEVITTPYSFVATTHAIRMAGLEPVFVDVRSQDLNLDPSRIEAAITRRTSAILAVHVYGNPCDVEAIQATATRHGLTVIYDAAHAFGVRYKGRSLLSYGDFATLSFHATKVFNTFEGGAVVSRDHDGKRNVDSRRNFGISDEVNVDNLGTNAKLSEFNAALGILQIDHFDQVRLERSRIDSRYRSGFAGVTGIKCLDLPHQVQPNFSYFPVLITEDYPLTRDELYEKLKLQGIFGRRYFYPLLSALPMYRDLPSSSSSNLPTATRAAAQILCLPIYPGLSIEDQDRVINCIVGHVTGEY